MKSIKRRKMWSLFLILSVFDNVWSYIAVKYRGLHELNAVIAPTVEKKPWLYLLAIPIELLAVYIVLHLLMLVMKILLNGRKDRNIDVEDLTTTCVLIFWIVATTSVNLLSIFIKLPQWIWSVTSIFGLVLVFVFIMSVTKKERV